MLAEIVDGDLLGKVAVLVCFAQRSVEAHDSLIEEFDLLLVLA